MDEGEEFEAWFGKAVRKVQEGQRALEEELEDVQPDDAEEIQED